MGVEQKSEQRHHGEEDYKQSKWAGIIDGYLGIVEGHLNAFGSMDENIKAMYDWADWMRRGGFRTSEDEIQQKIHEILEIDNDTQ